MSHRLQNDKQKNLSGAAVTDLAAYRAERAKKTQQSARESRLDKSESLADYYLDGSGKRSSRGTRSSEENRPFEQRLSSIKSTLDKLNILMEKISHLEKRHKL